MGLDLPAEAVSTLERRTEGWIVGLQMAAISMQGRKQDGDLAAFVEAFGGTNRYILDYLMEEVLNQQPPAIQDFLIETSILERMCADLCELAVQHGRKPATAGDSQAILAQLERSNLFVIPLDDERRWYRYHHLFADLLKSTLRQRRSAEEIRELHRRASRWHQGEGSLEEAMIHAMAAQDFERAASMIEENIVSMLSRSEAPVLLGWIEKLPEQIVRGRPWIDVYRANTLALSGRLEQVEPLLEDVEKRIEPDAPQAAELLGHIAAIRAYAANLRGDAARVIEMAALAERYLPEEHLNARGMAAYALADTYFAGDDMDGASEASLKMLRVGEKTGRLLMAVPALCDLAAIKKVQGRLHQAEEFYDRARQWMVERKGLDSRVRCPYEVGLADLLREWNQLDAAYEHAVTGIEYSQRLGVYSLLVSGYVALMRILQARGDVEGALDALRNAEQVMQTHHVRLATRIELQDGAGCPVAGGGRRRDGKPLGRGVQRRLGTGADRAGAAAAGAGARGRRAAPAGAAARAGRGGWAHRPVDRNPGPAGPGPGSAGPARRGRRGSLSGPLPGQARGVHARVPGPGMAAVRTAGAVGGAGRQATLRRGLCARPPGRLPAGERGAAEPGGGGGLPDALARRSAGWTPSPSASWRCCDCSPRASRTKRSPAGWSSPRARSNST